VSTSRSRSSYHHGNLREALIEAATALLHEGGAEALSLRAAARRAGVSAMAPYRHFANKEALLAAVAAHGFTLLAARLAEADAAPDPANALVAQGVAYVRFACEDPSRFRLMFGAAQPQGYPDLRAAAGAAYAMLARRVAGLAEEGRRDDLTLACWSLVHGLASLLVDGQVQGCELAGGDMAERITRLLLRCV
jgi:AcrR family transcriptional regulator